MLSRRAFLASSTAAALSAAPAPRTAEVRPHLGKPTLFVDGHPTYPGFYALTDALGGRWSFDELPQLAIAAFVKAGFRLFQLDLFLESVWPQDGPLDLTLARRQIRGVLDQCPGAAIVLRWHLNAPRWWTAAHPEECVRWANPQPETPPRTQPVRILMDDLSRVPRASLASEAWHEMATAKTREFLQALARTPEGDALIGIHLACGVYGEWHYWGFMNNEPDFSAPMQRHFDRWRRAHAKSPVPVPSTEDRAALDDGIFRHPARRQSVIDYYRAQQELVADNILHFTRLAKQTWPRKLLTGAFYGYFFSLFNRSATGGHLELQRVLASPDIDYLSAPQAYGDPYRAPGSSGITRGLVESVRLHGKLFLDEMDQTPSWQWRNDVDTAFKLSDLDLDRALIRRNTVTSFTRGMGLWYYDFGPANAAGWWNDTRLMDDIARLKALLDHYHQRPYTPAADVLFVFDTEVFYCTGSLRGADPLTDPLAVNRTIQSAWAAGASIETIHLADLERVDLDRFKAVVFANTWLLTAAQRRFLRQRVMAPSRHVIFQCLPGYTDGRTLNLDFAREATGLDLHRVAAAKPFAPQLAVGRSEFAPVRSGNTWFSTLPINTPEAWRVIFAAAGAHLYTDTGDIVHAGAGLVLIHTVRGGARILRFRSGRSLEVELAPKSSWIFDAATGERLL
jgi:hypothetical protein